MCMRLSLCLTLPPGPISRRLCLWPSGFFLVLIWIWQMNIKWRHQQQTRITLTHQQLLMGKFLRAQYAMRVRGVLYDAYVCMSASARTHRMHTNRYNNRFVWRETHTHTFTHICTAQITNWQFYWWSRLTDKQKASKARCTSFGKNNDDNILKKKKRQQLRSSFYFCDIFPSYK